MIEGMTRSGFIFSMDDGTLDDYELFEDLVELAGGNELRITSVVDRLLGKEQKKRLMDHLRLENGRVPSSLVIGEVLEIFNACKQGKNS